MSIFSPMFRLIQLVLVSVAAISKTTFSRGYALLLGVLFIIGCVPSVYAYPQVLVQHRTDADGTERLLTPVARYKDAAGRTIDLVGAVHLADAAYYRNLNRAFASRYDKVLYEMVDGDGLPEYLRLARKVKQGTATTAEKEKYETLTKTATKKDSSAAAALGRYYVLMSNMLQLHLQTELIDYSLENMVFADMSSAEFAKAMAERGESWLTIVLQSLAEEQSRSSSAWSFSRSAMRRELIRALAASSVTTNAMQQGAIIVSRNERCFAVLDEQLASAPSGTRIAIFYGAMHLRDMHYRLLSRGFSLQGVQWLTAIRT